MLDELKFVKGSVSTKDFAPALTHFVIENYTVRGYNGIVALGSPIAFDISCKPRGEQLVKAISNCDGDVELRMTPTGRLSIKSGKFKALIDCIDCETPHVIPEGQPFQIDGKAILQAFKILLPLVGTDASRPWCEGILLDGQSAFATNNVILAEYWCGAEIPHPVNIPKVAIKEMVRIGEEPIGALILDSAITFLYSEERWIRTQLLATDWPDIRVILNKESHSVVINDELFTALEVIKPFTGDKLNKVYINGSVVSTHYDPEDGACYEIDADMGQGVYTLDMLYLLKNIATTIDWSFYPAPCPFFGDRVRGVIVGLKN